MRRQRWLEHGVAALVVLGATLAFFWPAVADGRTFTTIDRHQDGIYPWADPEAYEPIVQSDEADLSFPAQALLTRSIQDDGTLPLWDPSSYGGGTPNYTDGGNPVAYPPRLLLAWLVDPVRAHLLFTAGHLLVAGLATYSLGRQLRAGLFGSLLMALSWMFGAFNMAFLHLDQVAALPAVLPLSVVVVDRAVVRSTWSAAAGAGVVLGVGLLGGHLLFLSIAVGLGLLWGALQAARAGLGDREGTTLDRLAPLGRVAFTGVVAVGVAAVMLVPTLQALASGAREPVDRNDVAGVLARFGDMAALFRAPGPELTGDSIHTQPFVGTVAAVLAVAGACTRRRGAGFGRLLVVGTVLAATTTVGARLFLRVPGLDAFRPLGRLSVYLAFGVVVLAGVGAAAITERAWRVAGHDGGRRAVAIAAAAVVLAGAAGQVLGHGRAINPDFSPLAADELYPEVPLLDAVLDQTGPGGYAPLLANVRGGRAYGGAPILHGAEAMVFGIDASSGYRSSMPRRTFDLLRVLEGLPVDDVLGVGSLGSFIPQVVSDQARLALLPRLGYELLLTAPTLPADLSWLPKGLEGLDLRLVHTDPTGSLYRIGAARAVTVAGTVVAVDDDAGALRAVADVGIDLVGAVVLTPDQVERLGEFTPTAGAEGTATLARSDPNHLDADVEVSGAAVVVLPVNWDPGWSAELDGRRTPVLRVDYGRVGIAVPEGTHELRLAFVPPGLRIGAATSTATLVFVLEVTAWGPVQRLLRRRRGGAQP